MVSDVDEPNYRIVRIKLDQAQKEKWTEIITEGKTLLGSVNTGGGYLFANYLKKATDRWYQMGFDGKGKKEIQRPGLGNAGGAGRVWRLRRGRGSKGPGHQREEGEGR